MAIRHALMVTGERFLLADQLDRQPAGAPQDAR